MILKVWLYGCLVVFYIEIFLFIYLFYLFILFSSLFIYLIKTTVAGFEPTPPEEK